ncbi:hypothetical protein FACS1894187_05450 [Synergistales bacterium]|nr:hypothetical protein FACS1894187_05450 [Synergistales bacterium]
MAMLGKTIDAYKNVTKIAESADNQPAETHFHHLCATGTPEEIEVAIANGADMNAKDDYDWTALIYAAASNPNSKVISLLLENGADVSAKSISDTTALMGAAGGNSNPEVISLLLENGADVNAKNEYGMTALMSAARYNSNPQAVATLFANGADVSTKNNNGKTALDYAKKSLHLKNSPVLKQLEKATRSCGIER